LNLRIIGPILTTIYFWEQDGVLGIVTIDGEHAAENLEYCELIKYVF